MKTREEQVAIELHKFYRAALLAVGRLSKSRMHDHGWSLCGRSAQDYFLKRAKLIVRRAEGKDLDGTINSIENHLRSKMLMMGIEE